ncbi:hypothetical protein V6N13_067594 [Hibiscus sabdariffa]
MSSQTGLLYLLQATARVICKRHMISAVLVTCVAMFHNCKSFSFYIAGLSREEYLKDYHPARFVNERDAERAILRLNGFRLFGFRISVSFAKFGNREPPDTGKSFSEKCLDSSQTKSASIRTKIIGFVEEEKLWKLQKCLVGVFLLEINDETLFNSLRGSKWSYLLEVFVEVHPWSSSFRIPERVVWVELVGIPLHCWNHQTFKRIAEVWGELLFLGENASMSLGVEKMTMVLSTNQWEKIETVVDIEVGSECFPVRIFEIPSPEKRTSIVHKFAKPSDRNSQSSSASSSGLGNTAGADKEKDNPLDTCPSLKAGSRSWVDVVSGRADGSDLLRAQKLAQSENRGREAASRSLENMNLDGSNPVLAQCVAESEVNGGQKKVRASPGTSLLPISDQGVAWAHEPPLSP